jgi:hypothetical protein
MPTLEEQRNELAQYVEGLKGEFVQQLALADAGGGLLAPLKSFGTWLLERFDQLLGDVGSADHAALLALRQRADELKECRFVVMPVAEMRATARARLSEMQEWGIPAASLQDVTQIVTSMQAADWKPDPYQIRRVDNEYDYWDEYTDWYFNRMTWFSVGLFVPTVLALVLSFVAFRYLGLFWGFLAAGIAGTGASILLKLPPMSVYGNVAPLGSQVFVRYAAGLVGVMVGAGFLALGLFTIKLPGEKDLTTIIESYDQALSATAASAPHSKAKRIGPDTPLNGDNTAKNLSDAGAGNLPILILMSLALLLGFSERSLASFETRFFGSGTPPK